MKKRLSKKQRQELKAIKKQALFNFNYKKAIEFYEDLLKKYQLSAKDLCDLGLFYDHLSIFDQKEKKKRTQNEEIAIKYYKKAENMDSQELAVFEGLGRIWWHRKDKKSIYYYQKGLDIAQTPRQKSEFLEYLGNAYMRMGQTQKAIKSYQEALKLKPVSKFSLFNNLAFAYQKINKSKEACSYAKRALRLLRKRTKEYRKTKAAQAFEKQLKELIKNRPSY